MTISADVSPLPGIPDLETARLKQVSSWFAQLHANICKRFELLESSHAEDGKKPRIDRIETRRNTDSGADGGGGTMVKFREGAVFEKAGVNVSEVFGTLSETARRSLSSRTEMAGLEDNPIFWASGVSVVCHMQNPRVPAVHMNTRMFWTPVRSWFGGGTDLNPCIEIADDTSHFHSVLKQCCNLHGAGYYDRFKAWAEEYFYICHRKRARGVGGVFFDDLVSGSFDKDFEFVKDLGSAFLNAWVPIVERRQSDAWTEADREAQLVHRGAYAEFNLVYDRGTRFGLESGHDPDAVLMSLPPVAKWP